MKKIRSFTLGQLQHIVDSHAELPVGNYVTSRLAVARSLDSSVVQSQFSHEPVQLHERRIMLLRRGWLRPVVNLVNECFSEGELVFLGTDSVVQFREYSPDLQGYGLSMSNELFSQALQGHIPPTFDGHLRSFHFPLTGSEMETFDTMHRLLYTMCRAGESEAVCHHLLAAILWYVDSLCKKREQEGGQASSREQRLFADFLSLVNRHASREHNIGFYASALCLSPRYMSSLIKQVSNRSAKAWIDEALATQAKVLLAHTEKTVAEIAFELSFPNAAFFSKFFQRLTGMTPSGYRQR